MRALAPKLAGSIVALALTTACVSVYDVAIETCRHIFSRPAFWKRIGKEYQELLIVTGTGDAAPGVAQWLRPKRRGTI